MKYTKNKILQLLFFTVFIFFSFFTNYVKAIDINTFRMQPAFVGTFNEYRYNIIEDFFKFREYYQLNGRISVDVANSILKNATDGFEYLPSTLINRNFYNDLSIALQRGISAPNSEVNYLDIVKNIEQYLTKVNIDSVRGNIEAIPATGNAPLTTTLRGRVNDPSGTVIPNNNYVWYVNDGGVRREIGRGASITHTINQEGLATVFLEVQSNHKNEKGNTDVLPFSSRVNIDVKEKLADVNISVNGMRLGDRDEIKFTPEEASYGIVIDATSSIPSGGAVFTRTRWDFGNGLTRSNDGKPRIERAVYANEGEYTVKLELDTNQGTRVKREFRIIVNDPIATIEASKTEGFIGDRINFSTRVSNNSRNLTFRWRILDIETDREVFSQNGNSIRYEFEDKGTYNVQLFVRDALGNQDTDTKIINIISRPPVASFTTSFPYPNKPSTVRLDGTRSFDPDFSDEGKLKYIWTINGREVELDNIDNNGAIGYYKFDSIGEQTIGLEVIDPDDMRGRKQERVRVNSLLDVDFNVFPRVTQRGKIVKFAGFAPNARFFEWDFGDGNTKEGTDNIVEHKFEKSGIINVTLTVRDNAGNRNSHTKQVYVGESNRPYAFINVMTDGNNTPAFDRSKCNTGGYIVNRTQTIRFDGSESINVDGETRGLTYSWQIGNNTFVQSNRANHRFDELGCYPVKLTVRSETNGTMHTFETNVYVENMAPTLNRLKIESNNLNSDPVVVNIEAEGARDPDGVIQSYLWYYYTDTDREPQEFRVTNKPETNFVIPKITGNYYFVVVMEDNNGKRVSNEDISEARYFITIAGDNINTPLVDLSVNKNSVLLGEEIVFNARVRNILGQDLTNQVEYAWDFNGDGFYTREGNEPTTTFSYNQSGTFYAKVRARYRGMSNVKTVEINVSNVLKPSFEYISIGDKFLFFSTSGGNYNSIQWDLGDGTKVEGKEYFIHEYSDGKRGREVVLTLREGNKAQVYKKQVNTNMRNLLNSREAEGIVVYSYPRIQDGEIILKGYDEEVFVYLGDSKGENIRYAIDYDINNDSELTGLNDDDIDNRNNSSFNTGNIDKIKLNNSREQTIRVFLLGENDEVIDSKDIKIIKEFVEKGEEIDPNTIIFSGVSNDELAKIETLKNYVSQLPQEHRLRGMQYIQKLQEEWFYASEKIRIILDFSQFIDSVGGDRAYVMIEILESFIVEGQEDQSVRNMAYNVIKNIIPSDLPDYNYAIELLDEIRTNPDKIEENKVLAMELLELIRHTHLMTNDDKLLVRTQLEVIIYGGIENIPEKVRDEITDKTNNSKNNKLVGILLLILKWIIYSIIITLSIVLLFYLWYRVTNKDPSFGFQDFIIEKTSGSSSSKKEEVKPVKSKVDKDFVDPLATVDKTSRDEFSEKPKKEDVLGGSIGKKPEEPKKQIPDTNENKSENKVPDWLKGSMGEGEKPKKEDVLGGSVGKKPEEPKKQIPDTNENKSENKVPDWLKGTVDEPNKSDVKEEKVPDWLKGALGAETKKETPKVEAKKEAPKVEAKKEAPKVEVKKEAPKVEAKKEAPKVEAKKEAPKVEAKKEAPKAEAKKDDKNKGDNLWEDGMDIPDWLKGSPFEEEDPSNKK